MEFLGFTLLGVLAGILAGLLGIGGGTIFTPVLLYVFSHGGLEQPVKWTIATSLFCSFNSALVSSLQQIHKYRLFLRDALGLSISGIAGTWIAQAIIHSGYYDKRAFALLFSGVLCYTAYRFLNNNVISIENKRQHRHRALELRDMAYVGLSSGLVSSLAGIGGGMVIVPAMTFIYHQHLRKVIATSSLVVVLVALAGWLQLALATVDEVGMSPYTWGYVDFGAATPLVIGSFSGALIGVRLGQHVNKKNLQRIFGFVAIALALKLWWDFLL